MMQDKKDCKNEKGGGHGRGECKKDSSETAETRSEKGERKSCKGIGKGIKEDVWF